MTPAEPGLPRFTGWLRPVVDAVARIHAGVHRKLLFGFLAGALLLVAMAVLSLVVIGRMNERDGELDHAQVKASRAQEMLYAVTAQSHYRAMASSSREDATSTTPQVDEAKKTFSTCSTRWSRPSPANADFFDDVRTINDEYTESGRKVLTLFEAGDIQGATHLHLDEEHPHLAQAGGVD